MGIIGIVVMDPLGQLDFKVEGVVYFFPYRLGTKSVHRSTLAYVNEHRSHELFKETLSRCCPNVNS
jgi:hypothetical protein